MEKFIILLVFILIFKRYYCIFKRDSLVHRKEVVDNLILLIMIKYYIQGILLFGLLGGVTSFILFKYLLKLPNSKVILFVILCSLVCGGLFGIDYGALKINENMGEYIHI